MNDFIVDGIAKKLAFFRQRNALHLVFSAKESWQPEAPMKFIGE